MEHTTYNHLNSLHTHYIKYQNFLMHRGSESKKFQNDRIESERMCIAEESPKGGIHRRKKEVPGIAD